MTVQRRKHAATRVAFRLESNADPTALLGLITLCARLATERTLRDTDSPRALVWSLCAGEKAPSVSSLDKCQCARYSTGTRL